MLDYSDTNNLHLIINNQQHIDTLKTKEIEYLNTLSEYEILSSCKDKINIIKSEYLLDYNVIKLNTLVNGIIDVIICCNE